jgi:glycosyltransferase involved in cell wall biosynthesis
VRRFPDAHLGWLPYALTASRRLGFDVAYSSSGPFTSHVVGLALKRLSGKPWVAELRDGWYRWNRAIFPDYPAWRNVLEQRLEAIALRNADRVILVTDRMADAFRGQYSDLPASHFRVVSNGFDPAQFVARLPEETASSGFNVTHSGALYYGRSLAAFLDAAERLCAANRDFAESFSLTLLGSLDASAQHELASRDVPVHFVGQVSHAESLAAMRSADLLLLVANTTSGAEATVPGKLFEYLAVGRPILGIAPAESSTADVLKQTGGGWLAPAHDVAAIACALERAFMQRATAANPQKVARYSRRALTGELAAIFDELV